MPRFTEQTVIVTGGAGGIGGATCRRFDAEGVRVAVFDLNLEAAEKVATELRAAGGQALAKSSALRDLFGFHSGDGTKQILKTIIARSRASRQAVGV